MPFGLFKKKEKDSYEKKIKELLNCRDEDAKEINDLLNKMIKDKITDIVREDDNVGIVLYAYSNAGDKYIIDITRDLVVEDIYKNDRDGERIYFVMF